MTRPPRPNCYFPWKTVDGGEWPDINTVRLGSTSAQIVNMAKASRTFDRWLFASSRSEIE